MYVQGEIRDQPHWFCRIQQYEIIAEVEEEVEMEEEGVYTCIPGHVLTRVSTYTNMSIHKHVHT